MAARTNGTIKKVRYSVNGGAEVTIEWPDPPPDGTEETIPAEKDAADRFLDAMGDDLKVDAQPPDTEGGNVTSYTFKK